MALANTSASFSKASDDEHDQIGSNSSTPPGVATPRPDLTDKRLPGISHSYFGQVRNSFRARPKPASTCAPSVSPTLEAVGHRGEHQEGRSVGDALPTAPCSPIEASSGDDERPPLLAHERLDMPRHAHHPQHRATFFYPTPPTSSASSVYDASKDGPYASGSVNDNGSSSHAWPSHDDKTAVEASPLKLRRHTFAVTSPAPTIITESPVHATHISNPASISPSDPVAPHSSTSEYPSASQSDQEAKKLTESATVSRDQATPPQTPRSQSHETHQPSNLTHPPKSASGTNAALLGTPRGKLSVFISAGRGLRPSVDPYVVCQFQWAEYISDGPRNADRAQGGNSNGMTIKRVDNGRPMAIPMKSRQNSHTSNADHRDSKQDNQVTNPKWEHEAFL